VRGRLLVGDVGKGGAGHLHMRRVSRVCSERQAARARGRLVVVAAGIIFVSIRCENHCGVCQGKCL
jgi:hypothetical protein